MSINILAQVSTRHDRHWVEWHKAVLTIFRSHEKEAGSQNILSLRLPPLAQTEPSETHYPPPFISSRLLCLLEPTCYFLASSLPTSSRTFMFPPANFLHSHTARETVKVETRRNKQKPSTANYLGNRNRLQSRASYAKKRSIPPTRLHRRFSETCRSRHRFLSASTKTRFSRTLEVGAMFRIAKQAD